ncbi:MAG TPA: acetoin utilization protein AcuC [Thermoplasmata archaeon]|nr:acetoin utilization protein AcuC [Thermoplasmata archaeon]
MKAAIVYDEDFLRYDFGGGHALREVRVELARDLMHAYGLLEGGDELRPKPAGEAAIRRVHTDEYLSAVRKLSADPNGVSYEHGLGTADNPVFGGMYEAAALQAGATLLACEEVASGRRARAFNLGGGFHHAMPDKASGFCLLNDLAIGIRSLLDDHGVSRILYVDVDAHHGDGVQWIFYEDPRVLTISLHEDGHYLFPGSGFVDEIGKGKGEGYAVNVPLPPYTRDVSYLFAFQEVVPPLARAFRPEVIVSQLGADAHYLDPLTHLMLTTETYEAVGRILDELSNEMCGGRWIAAGGGGYDVTAVPRVWTLLFAQMAGARLDDALPVEWLKECKRLAGAVPADKALRDQGKADEEPHVPHAAKRTVDELKRLVFPLHGIA